MKNNIHVRVMMVGLLCAPYAVMADTTSRFHMYVGESQFIKDSALSHVSVGSGDVLSVKEIENQGVLVTALKSGDTTLKLWSASGYKTIDTYVYPVNVNRILNDVRTFLKSYPEVSADIIGDKVVIQGKGLSVLSKGSIDKFLEGQDYVVNLTTLAGDRTAVDDKKMIYMDVKIMEISQGKNKNIGINWDDGMVGPKFAVMGDFKKSNAFVKGQAPEEFEIAGGQKRDVFQTYAGLTGMLMSRINLLQNQGFTKMIAQPVLSCKNGDKASFLSGGQIPYTAASATGTPSVEFKDYGIKLEVEPYLREDGTILAKVLAEVSDIDLSISVDGSPGILTRKTETNFAIKNGETMVLSGLVNKTKSHADDGVPLLSRIPILGYLFKNREKAQKQTELVFLVTPYTYDQPEKTTERVKDTLEKELDGESQLFLKAPQKEDQKTLLLKTGE